MKKGFTLIELLIYVGLLSITAGFLTSILLITVRIQNRQISSYEVTSQSNFAIDYIKRALRESSTIESESGKPLSYIKLRTKNPQKDPTYITLISGGQIQIKEGANASTTITTNKIRVDNLQFTKFANYPGHDAVQINLTASYNTQNPQFNVSQTLTSAISRVSAATFDDSLTPGSNNTFDLGQPLVNWRNAYFGGNLTVDTDTLFVNSATDRVGIGTLNPGSPLSIRANNSAGSDRANQFSILGDTNPNLGLFLGIHTEAATPYADIGFVEEGTTWRNIILAKNGGSVGIGTANPTQKFSVVGGGAEFINQGENIEIGGNTANPSILLEDSDGTGGNPYIAFAGDTSGNNQARIGYQSPTTGISPPRLEFIAQQFRFFGDSGMPGEVKMPAGLTVDENTASSDSFGITWYSGNGSVAQNDRVLMDIFNNDFRVVGALNGGAAAIWAIVDNSSGWRAGSSQELKQNINELTSTDLKDLRVAFNQNKIYEYERKDDPGIKEIGFIAEEAPAIILGSDGKTVSYLKAIGALAALDKEQEMRIQNLEKRISSLEAALLQCVNK